MGIDNLRAYGSRVIVKKEEVKEATNSGIYLPGGADPTFRQAEIVSVGPDVKEDISEGDTVLYHKDYGTDINVLTRSHSQKTKDYMVIFEEDILAKLEK